MKFGVNLSTTGVLVLLTIYINYFIVDIDNGNTKQNNLRERASFNSKRFRISKFGSIYLLQLVFCRLGIDVSLFSRFLNRDGSVSDLARAFKNAPYMVYNIL